MDHQQIATLYFHGHHLERRAIRVISQIKQPDVRASPRIRSGLDPEAEPTVFDDVARTLLRYTVLGC
jgi:hypothetical protein